tara:strand:- start:9229 stop:9543 length:315 start_codon:yes stop_codon:yes gene_type:complete
MRKIERQMNNAITNGQNFSSSNTTVTFENDLSYVYLHGNHIATIGEGFVKIFDGGWQSNTTKSRLNAILSEHAAPSDGVFQKNFVWYVSDNGRTVPFTNGYEFQ